MRTRFVVVPAGAVLEAEEKAGRRGGGVFRAELHPRDARGRFIRAGAGVRLSSGRTGRVAGVRDRNNVVVDTDRGPLTVNRRMVTVEGGARNGKVAPLTDEEFEARQKLVSDAVGKARKTLATELTHAEGEAWHPDRDRIHREIAAELYAKAAKVPNDGKAVMAGGLGGAGKTTVLRDHAGIDPSQYLTINPDDIKEVLAERGLVPEIPDAPHLSPMERAALVHEESSRIGKLLADMAYRDKKNMIWDITMSSEGGVTSRLDQLAANGYTEVVGVFVDIPVETSVERALSRYRRGVDQWNEGKGHGGRYVPPAIIRAQKTSSGRSVNREVFDGLASRFSNWSVYDNSRTGQPPVRVASKK